MQNSNISQIEKLVDEKVIAFENYLELTKDLTTGDFDKVSMIFDQRQNLINVIDSFDLRIKVLTQSIPTSERALLQKALDMNNPNEENFTSISNKTKKLKRIVQSIQKIEIEVKKNLESMKSELDEQFKQSNKDKKVLDYFKTFDTDMQKGATFNSKQ